MTDASKRLRETEDEAWTDSEYDGSSWALPTSMTPMAQQPPSNQMPVMNHPGATKVVLPPGVSSIDEWGRTMCEFPAVAALKKSYLELAEDPTLQRGVSRSFLKQWEFESSTHPTVRSRASSTVQYALMAQMEPKEVLACRV